MRLSEISLYTVTMQLKTPFVTSTGAVTHKTVHVLKAVDAAGTVGWGESVAFDEPTYTEETAATVEHMLKDFFIPRLLHRDIQHPDEVYTLLQPYRRNAMAKAAIEGAVWDIYAQQTGQSLAAAIGGVRTHVAVGAAIGLKESDEALFDAIEQSLAQGYKRIKVKIKPGQDIDVIRTIRSRFPNVPLMADANSAYTLADIPLLKALDDYNLMMIEQPLAYDDLLEHAELQRQLTTPICLDESITSVEDMRRAIALQSCRVVNIKIARVGGISEAKRIHDLCAAHHIAVWCGGMLEAGISRAQCVALASLSHFTMPADTAASARYWYEDIIEPEVTVERGLITVPTAPGLGLHVKEDFIRERAIRSATFQ